MGLSDVTRLREPNQGNLQLKWMVTEQAFDIKMQKDLKMTPPPAKPVLSGK